MRNTFMEKNSLEIIKEMTNKIRQKTESLYAITERRYQYTKDECINIFNNVFNAINEYVENNKKEDAYALLLDALSDRFKISPQGGDISAQVDKLSSGEELFEKQTEFQDVLDNAKDIVEFINNKSEKYKGDDSSDKTLEEVPEVDSEQDDDFSTETNNDDTEK